VLKWPKYYYDIFKLIIRHGKSANDFSSYQVSIHKIVQQISYHIFATQVKSTKGEETFFYISTWRPTIDNQNSSQFVWAGLAWGHFFHFIVWCKRREEKRREEEAHPTSPSCSQEQDNYILDKLMSLTTIGSSCSQDQAKYISLTNLNLCDSRPLDPLIHKIQPQLSLTKLMSLTTIGSSSLTRSTPTILDKLKTYVTHDHWLLFIDKINPNYPWQNLNLCHSRPLGPLVCKKSKDNYPFDKTYTSW
jgi:hypothetical protein